MEVRSRAQRADRAASSAVMVGKLEPGTRGGMHTHTAEEIPFGEETLTMVNFVPSAILLTTFEDEVAPIGVRTLLAGAPQELVAKPPPAATSGATSQRTP